MKNGGVYSTLVALAFVLTSLVLSGCKDKTAPESASTTKLFPITVQLDWFAEPEHGAFFTAEQLGYFEAEGLAVTLITGGPNAYVTQKVATGEAQVGQFDSTNSLLAIQQGLPITNIAVVFQHDPTVLMMHESNPVHSVRDLDGALVKSRPEWAFLAFIKKRYGVEFKLVPQDFGLQEFAANPLLLQQGFYTSEPYFLQQQGISVRWLNPTDAGFDSMNTLIANRDFARKHPEQIRALLRAYYRGYKEYIEGNPEPAHKRMMELNSNATAEFLTWCRQQMIDGNICKGFPEKGAAGDYVMISAERVARQIKMLEELGILEKGAVTVEAAVDASFLPDPSTL